jgi:ABC-2 type transport system ATP-binding protein
MTAIETHELSKDYFGGFWRPRPYRALDRVTFAVERGEVFGFLGPNGAGKTTTLKLLMQLVFPTAGRASILGKPVGDVEIKRRIGYLPENPYFYDYLTAEELLTYFAGLFGYTGPSRRQRVAHLLDEVGLDAERRMQLRKFSKGMIQRIGLAQALINDPEVIFLDEPMSGLDPLGRRDVRALILRLRDQGRTVFFCSHILSDAETLCTRVAIVAKGRLMASGSLSELLAQQLRGWELVLDGLPAPPGALGLSAGHLSAGPGRVTRIDTERYAIEIGPVDDPLHVAATLLASGGRVVSINPLRETLEDLFVRQVGEASGADRSLGAAPMVRDAAPSEAGAVDLDPPRAAGGRG